MNPSLRRWMSSAGLIAGPGCWLISTQAAYTVSSQACESQREILTPTLLALIGVVIAGALISAWSLRSGRGRWFDERGGAAEHLLAAVGMGAAVLFGLVIANQLAAMLVIERCLR